MARETKVGLVVSLSFLSLVGVVVYCKYYRVDLDQALAGQPANTETAQGEDGNPVADLAKNMGGALAPKAGKLVLDNDVHLQPPPTTGGIKQTSVKEEAKPMEAGHQENPPQEQPEQHPTPTVKQPPTPTGNTQEQQPPPLPTPTANPPQQEEQPTEPEKKEPTAEELLAKEVARANNRSAAEENPPPLDPPPPPKPMSEERQQPQPPPAPVPAAFPVQEEGNKETPPPPPPPPSPAPRQELSPPVKMPKPEEVGVPPKPTEDKPAPPPVENSTPPAPGVSPTRPTPTPPAADDAPEKPLAPAPAPSPAPDPGTTGNTRTPPPVGAPVTAVSPPIVVPGPGASRQTPPPPAVPEVESFDEETYRWKAGDTFEAISQQVYRTDKLAQAVIAYNRAHPCREDGFRTDAASIPAGTMIFLPPISILEKRYPSLIPGLTPIQKPAPPPLAEGGPVERPSNATPSAAGFKMYRVLPPGERVADIARMTLGNWERWPEIYRLNQNWRPEFPLPANAVLRLPNDATVPAEHVPPQ